MERCQLRLSNIKLSGEKKVEQVHWETKGKYVRDEFSVDWYTLTNIKERKNDMYKLMLAWCDKTYGLGLGLEGAGKNTPLVNGYLRYRPCDKLSFGAKYVFKQTPAVVKPAATGKKPETASTDTKQVNTAESPKIADPAKIEHKFTMGVKWTADKDTTVRSSIDCDLLYKMNVQHKLSDSTSVGLTTQTNLYQYFPNAPKYEGGRFGYPLNFGFVWKLDG